MGPRKWKLPTKCDTTKTNCENYQIQKSKKERNRTSEATKDATNKLQNACYQNVLPHPQNIYCTL